MAQTSTTVDTTDQVQPASEPQDGEATNDDASAALSDEIIVTARRREESLQKVPVAVTALTDDMLTQNNIQQTTDLQRLVPGVVFSGAGTDANTTFSIRGQGKDVIGPGLPSVISYFNEVPLPGFGGVVPTYDMGSIQILKGPQGTLFGRNTTGGAVLLYSKAPTDQFGGYVQVTGGDYFWHAVQGAINLPVTEGVALRVAGNVERRDGYTKNLGFGADFDELHNDAFRVSLKLNPTDNIENVTVYDYFLKDAAYSSIVAVGSAPGAVPYNNGLAFAGIVGAENAALIDQSFNCNVSVECDVDLQIARQLQIGPVTDFMRTECAICDNNSSAALPSSSQMPIAHPSAAISRQITCPKGLAPPVTSTFLPAMSSSMIRPRLWKGYRAFRLILPAPATNHRMQVCLGGMLA